MEEFLFSKYIEKISAAIQHFNTESIFDLAHTLWDAWSENRQVFLCGNGGSAANAMHIANDLLYGIAGNIGTGKGMRVQALPANQSIITCLANDISYEDIFSYQLSVLAQPGDILIALSGSGNSPNIIKAIQKATEIGMKSIAILGYAGGKCLGLADVAIHFPFDDMQIAEDCQLMVGHMVMRWLADCSAGLTIMQYGKGAR